jgi:hypothetical protein
MSKGLNTLLNVDTVENILKAIDSSHHSFPVLNHLGNVVGLIPRNFIITLLENRGFYMSGKKRKMVRKDSQFFQSVTASAKNTPEAFSEHDDKSDLRSVLSAEELDK